jgi:short-subunit dehydrogenase
MKGKVVIITGASSGIGYATALKFAELGAKVVMAARNYEELLKLEKELTSKGQEVFAVKTDVSVEHDCKVLIDKAIDRFQKIDILINNAGISMRALFANMKIDVMKRLMDVNFWGTVYCTKYALPHILKTKGVIVGVSSIAGFHGLPGRAGYSASKFALHGFLETIRIEYLKNDIHVLIMAPGFTKSKIRESALLGDGSQQGVSPINEDKLMSTEVVAKKMIRAIKRKKRNKILSTLGQLLVLFQRILPETVDRCTYKKMAKEPDSPFK